MKERLIEFRECIRRMQVNQLEAARGVEPQALVCLEYASRESVTALGLIDSFEPLLSSSTVSIKINGQVLQNNSYTRMLIGMVTDLADVRLWGWLSKSVDLQQSREKCCWLEAYRFKPRVKAEVAALIKLVELEIANSLKELRSPVMIRKDELASLMEITIRTLCRYLKSESFPAKNIPGKKNHVLIDPEYLDELKKAQVMSKNLVLGY